MSFEDPVTIVSSDEKEIIAERDVAEMSKTIKNLLEDIDSDQSIPIPNVDYRTLEQIVKYMTHHHEHPEDHLNVKDTMDDISDWDVEFVGNLSNEMLFNVIMGSNYLDVEHLLKLTCKTVARKIKGKTPEEVKKALAFEVNE